MNCDCPRTTGIVHYEECPLHDPNSCAACETENHGNKLIAKKARAEVLAACIERANNSLHHRADCRCDQCQFVDELIESLRQLQPAASDLEELLRKEREKHWIEVLYEVRRQLVGARNIHGLEQAKEILTVQDAASLLWWIDERVKEKARAEGKG